MLKKLFSKNRNNKIIIKKDNKVIIISQNMAAYKEDLENDFNYYFNSVDSLFLDGVNVVDFSSPKLHLLPKTKIPFYFSGLAESEDVNNYYTENSNLKDGDVVIDLGAYCGLSTYAFSKIIGNEGKVYSLEPDPINYAILKQNVLIHKLTNVTHINKAIWSERSKLYFNKESNLGGSLIETGTRSDQKILVETTTINNIIKENNIHKLKLIKIDIEGAEIEVLKSSKDILKKLKPNLIMVV